jgi:hypothetical protein
MLGGFRGGSVVGSAGRGDTDVLFPVDFDVDVDDGVDGVVVSSVVKNFSGSGRTGGNGELGDEVREVLEEEGEGEEVRVKGEEVRVEGEEGVEKGFEVDFEDDFEVEEGFLIAALCSSQVSK